MSASTKTNNNQNAATTPTTNTNGQGPATTAGTGTGTGGAVKDSTTATGQTTSTSPAVPVVPGFGSTTPTLQSTAGLTTSGTSQETTQQTQPSTISGTSTGAAAGASSTQTSSTTDEDMGYTTGALAGAIVGSIIGAAIITFLVTWLFFGKRKKQEQRDQRPQRSASHHSRDHRSPGRHGAPPMAAAGMAEKTNSSSGDLGGYSWQAYLPQSADDQTVSRDVKTLFDQIELHVDNYYTRANVRIDSSTSRALSQFDGDSSSESMERLLSNPQTILPAIKHCIAQALIARMSPGNERASLLPQYLAVEPSKLNSSMPPGESTAAQQAYSQWRVLNAYLHPRPEQDRSYQGRRETAARDISEQLSSIFGPWQGPQENVEGLKQHEKSLVMRAGDVATLIMSQPSAYEFRWTSGSGGSSRSFVVFPGFWKTSDERGRPLEQPQPLVAPVFPRA